MNRLSLLQAISVILISLFWSSLAGTFAQRDPIWQTSPFFRANNEKVIKTLTGNQSRPSYTFTFSSALSGTPNIAYGIKGYQGNDFLGQQLWQIQRQDNGINSTHFSVYIQIYGVTNLNILNVAYIACQPTFPHHLNSFDNVPISYGSTLSNITAMSWQTQTYTNYINYSSQAAGRRFTKFTLPLSQNKVILFISSLFIRATFASGPNKYPVTIDVQTYIQSEEVYKIKGTFYHRFLLQRLHFSMIIFNEKDVASTNQYFLEFFVWTTPVEGGFISVPVEFKDNFILAMKDFDTTDGYCGIQYKWQFVQQNGVHGVLMDPSVISYGPCGQNSTRSTVFYMKTWLCPEQYKYFNLTSNKCQNGCGDYTFKNLSVLACDPCWFSCQQCYGTGASQCITCSLDVDHRYKAENGSCTCITGYYDDYINPLCPACSVGSYKCKTCYHVPGLTGKPFNTEYPCFQCLDGYFYESANYKCVNYTTCSASQNKFVNRTTNLCQTCVITGCKTCGTLYSCSVCDSNNEYFTSTTNSSACQKCVRATGCSFCKSLTTCKTCDTSNGYYLDTADYICKDCSYGCKACIASTQKCSSCDSTKGLKLNSITFKCQCNSGYYLDKNQTSWTCKACNSTCLECSGSQDNQCVSCNISQNRILDASKCTVCTLQGCSTCQTLATCKICDANTQYFTSTTNSSLCQKCVRAQGCLFCKSLTTCVRCDQNIGFFLDQTTYICKNCSYGCQRCAATTQICAQCDSSKGLQLNSVTGKCFCSNGTFLDQSLDPTKWTCQPCHSQCLQCFGPSRRQCISCRISQNRLLRGTQCPICTLQGCSTCETFTKCTTCNQTNKYWQNPQNPDICKKCIPPLGCKQCMTLTTCTECQQDKGYYMNSSQICVDCSAGCMKCDPDTLQCSQCKTGFVLNQLKKSCECRNGTYLVRLSTLCIQCNSLCLTCNGPSQYHCTSCYSSQQRQLVGSMCRCRNNYQEASTTSKTCVITDTKTCQAGYVYVQTEGKCKANCGDGRVIKDQEQCDDGNNKNEDGCSKQCKIEPDYTCDYLPSQNPQSVCHYNRPVTMSVLTVNKNMNSNTLEITTTLQPKIGVLEKLDWTKEIKVEGLGQVTIKNATYNQTTGKLTFNVDYQRVPKENETVTIKIQGNQTSTTQTGGQSLKATQTTIDFGNIQSTNNINTAAVYTEATYDNVQTAQNMVTAGIAIGLGTACVSLLIKNAVPAIQLVVAMQASFISLSTVTDIHPLVATLYGGSSIQGYNDQFSTNQSSSARLLNQLQSPNTIKQSNILALGYESSFFANSNIMLIAQGVLLLIVCFVYLLSIKNPTFKTPYKYFQRTLMAIITFNTVNNVFSMSLMSSAHVLDIALAVGAGCMIIGQIVHLCIYYKGYLGMDVTFEIHKVRFKTYFISMMLARISMAVIPAFMKDSPQIAVSVNLGIQGVLCIILTIIRPFAHKAMNVIMLIGEYALLAYLANLQVSTSLKDTISADQELGLILAWVQIGLFASMSVICMAAAAFGIYSQFCGKAKTTAMVSIDEDQLIKPPKNGNSKNNNASNSQFMIDDIESVDNKEAPTPEIHSPLKIDLDRLFN